MKMILKNSSVKKIEAEKEKESEDEQENEKEKSEEGGLEGRVREALKKNVMSCEKGWRQDQVVKKWQRMLAKILVEMKYQSLRLLGV